jgi:hypothetical protein
LGPAPDNRAGPLYGPAPSAAEEAANSAGGLWVSCYQGFEPGERAAADVARLGLLCGPPNGMRRVGDTLTGSVEPGKKASAHPLKARAGACYRIFAVADDGVQDLDVIVRSSRGSRLSTDDTDDRWPIVEPERPFCTFANDNFTVELSAEAGAGRYAAELWELPP